jgi:hypothetical protein
MMPHIASAAARERLLERDLALRERGRAVVHNVLGRDLDGGARVQAGTECGE